MLTQQGSRFWLCFRSASYGRRVEKSDRVRRYPHVTAARSRYVDKSPPLFQMWVVAGFFNIIHRPEANVFPGQQINPLIAGALLENFAELFLQAAAFFPYGESLVLEGSCVAN